MDLVGIIVLDVHVTAVSALSGGVVALSSLTQAVSVRAAGFTVLPLYSLVPAVKWVSLSALSHFVLTLRSQDSTRYHDVH